ncbi:MAG: adenosine deaminase, partial [Acidimicrobiia bacterium]
ALGPLAESVRERRIPLEVCPTSELHTGIYPSLSKHSVAALHRAGFVVTLNTDNRLMSRVSLTGEFEVVAETHGFDISDFRTVTVQALEAGFADRATRRELLEERVLPVYDKVS